ncbi:MAG: VOC family protein [Dehalococcoidia bacterium]|nr:VOC family protein [Dehalococcoidia bacterium]
MAVPLTRLNHAVLYVRDLDRAVAFYRSVFAFEEISRMGGQMAFLRAAGSDNHHDLGLMALGEGAPRPPRGATGLYHLAWEVPKLADLAAARDVLAGLGALVGQSDHGASKSLYAVDPDGNEFEVMWAVPRTEWGDFERNAVVRPLDLEGELERRRA